MTQHCALMADRRLAILIVEDDPLIGLDLEMAFEEAGYRVVGPAHNVANAMSLLDKHEVDMACLDYNLGRETSVPVAARLKRNGVNFVFATGLSREVLANDDVPRAPVLSKPVQPAHVMRALDA